MGKKLLKKKKKRSQKRNCNRNSDGKGPIDHPSTRDDALEPMKKKRHDYISSLPDDILRLIVSFLPFESAIRTNILSTRWSKLWNNSFVDKKLDDECIIRHGTLQDISNVIIDFLESYGELGSLRRWTLMFHSSHESIVLATIRGNRKLNLDFSRVQNGSTSQFEWKFKLPRRHSINHPPIIAYYVKTLHLRSVSHITKDIISTLISNFPLLESLILSECSGLQSLHIEETNYNHESLALLDCPQLTSLHVFAYTLRSFRYRGPLPWFWIKYVPNLTDVMLDFSDGLSSFPFSCENFLSLLYSLKDVKNLTLSGWFFEVSIPRWLPSAGAIFERCDFRFYYLRELWWIDSSMNKYKMDAMVSFLKICPNLHRIFIKIDPLSYRVPNASTWWEKKERCFWTDYSNLVGPAVRLNRLKIIKMTGFTNQDEEMLLADCLLKELTGSMEPIIIVESSENGTRRLVKVPKTPRKEEGIVGLGHRKQAATDNQETEYGYVFVEEEESCVLRPKHAYICL